MGQSNSFRRKKKRKQQTIHINSLLSEPISCPFCSKVLPTDINYRQLNDHLIECGKIYKLSKSDNENFSFNNDIQFNKQILKEIENFHFNEEIDPSSKEGDINVKIENLKNAISLKKISWQEGFCQIDINRQNFLEESMRQIESINIYKELKINFLGEKSYDAGGIIREWFTIIFQELEGDKLQLFIESEANDFSYIINPFIKRNEQNFKYFSFIGKLIGKALIDNMTINVCFNKIIYKMILKEKITFQDLVFIDTPLYNSIKNLKEMNNDNNLLTEGLCLCYNIQLKDLKNKNHSFDLIKNGKDIAVEDIDDYIQKRINFMIGLYEPFIKRIRDNLYEIIPKEKIMAFTADEFELLVNGMPFIDIEEWKLSTEYKSPYNEKHKVIVWFWEEISLLSQKELSNLLIFSTGSARVPLGGFSALESNRGNIAKFTIEYIQYYPNQKNYIKAHTCFNRLDLPCFKSKKELSEALHFICQNEINGFGID